MASVENRCDKIYWIQRPLNEFWANSWTWCAVELQVPDAPCDSYHFSYVTKFSDHASPGYRQQTVRAAEVETRRVRGTMLASRAMGRNSSATASFLWHSPIYERRNESLLDVALELASHHARVCWCCFRFVEVARHDCLRCPPHLLRLAVPILFVALKQNLKMKKENLVRFSRRILNCMSFVHYHQHDKFIYNLLFNFHDVSKTFSAVSIERCSFGNAKRISIFFRAENKKVLTNLLFLLTPHLVKFPLRYRFSSIR